MPQVGSPANLSYLGGNELNPSKTCEIAVCSSATERSSAARVSIYCIRLRLTQLQLFRLLHAYLSANLSASSSIAQSNTIARELQIIPNVQKRCTLPSETGIMYHNFQTNSRYPNPQWHQRRSTRSLVQATKGQWPPTFFTKLRQNLGA